MARLTLHLGFDVFEFTLEVLWRLFESFSGSKREVVEIVSWLQILVGLMFREPSCFIMLTVCTSRDISVQPAFHRVSYGRFSVYSSECPCCRYRCSVLSM